MYVISRCTVEDIPLVDSFLANIVFNEEPLVSANGPVVIPPAEESLSASVIPQGHSILVKTTINNNNNNNNNINQHNYYNNNYNSILEESEEEPATTSNNEAGRIIGVCLNDQPPQLFPSIYTNTDDDRKFQELFLYMEEKSCVCDVAPDALEVRLLAVDPEWRQKGIATILLNSTEKTARMAGFTWLKIFCTSHYSNKLMTKLGWKLLYSLNYEEYINNVDSGIRPPTKPHTHCNLYVKKVG